MPIRYRHYHLKKINEYMEMQEEARNNSSTPNKSSKKDKREQIPIPDFATKVKAPKK
jgi:hypothetical protein